MTKAPKIFNYNPVTGEYVGETIARLDPIDGTPMIPRASASQEPPNAGSNEVAVFGDGKWRIEPDYRGQRYWDEDQTPHRVTEIGEVLPDGAIMIAPVDPRETWDDDRRAWTLPLEAMKSDALDAARATATDYRNQIAGHVSPERAIAWAVKLPWALFWKANEGSDDPQVIDLLASAQAGFEDEGAITGDAAQDLRDAAIAKSAAFLRATQIVEGMESKASADIPAATSEDELMAVITQLRDLERKAAAKLEAIMEGNTNA